MSYSSLLRPRAEVLSEDGVEPIIDLANVEDKRKRRLEARPADFFDLTWPTNDLQRVVQALAERFSGKPNTPGLFLFEGLKGSGKSHLLVTIYHLFTHPSQAQAWLARHDLTCSLPSDAVIVVNKFTDLPLFSIWDFIFQKLTGRNIGKTVIQPGLGDVQNVVSDRRLILILDELEQGVRSIAEPAVQAQNIAFLQMLSEWGNRSDQVTLFASIYSDAQEPGSTLKRVPALRVQFAHSSERDRARVVLHRLFENHLDFDPKAASSVVDGYINYWERSRAFGTISADDYRDRLLQAYPFTPDLLDVILKRVPARGGFQNVRGALGFLANLVKLTHTSADLITPGQASLRDRETLARLADLDRTGDLVNRARDNMEDLASVALAPEIAAATLLYTLSSTGREVGATREELIRASVQPGTDINEFELAMAAFQKYAANFHENAGLYYFDLEENADAKVEFQSLRPEYEERAPAELRRVWLSEVFREPAAVVYGSDEAATREEIEKLDKSRLRWVLAPRRLTPQERHSLYFGLTARNGVVLLEPKDGNFDLDHNADLLKWMRRSLAARDLAARTKDAKRRDDYDRIAREERGYVLTAIKRASLVYVHWMAYGATPHDDDVEEEPLGNAVAKDDVLAFLGQHLYPVTLFVEHLGGRLDSLLRRTVKDVEQEYRNTLGFPVPTHADRISKAIAQLCKDRKLSLRHQRGQFWGSTPALNDRELPEAIIDAPFSEPAVRTVPGPQAQPPMPGASPMRDSQPAPIVTQLGATVPDLYETVTEQMQDIPTLPHQSLGELRQEIADRLQAIPNARVRQVRFSVLLERTEGDLSALPASLRGSLSGPGELNAEIIVTQRGDFSKAEIEQMAERLPVVSGAEYQATMKVVSGSSHD